MRCYDWQSTTAHYVQDVLRDVRPEGAVHGWERFDGGRRRHRPDLHLLAQAKCVAVAGQRRLAAGWPAITAKGQPL